MKRASKITQILETLGVILGQNQKLIGER